VAEKSAQSVADFFQIFFIFPLDFLTLIFGLIITPVHFWSKLLIFLSIRINLRSILVKKRQKMLIFVIPYFHLNYL